MGPAANASLPACLCLATLNGTALAGLARLFRSSSWVLPVMACLLVAHGLAWTLRRARVPNWASGPLTLLTAAAVLVWWELGSTTFYGLPTARTFSAIGQDLYRAHAVFGTAAAPVPPLVGFVLAAGMAAALVAVLSDWAAFRLEATLEALVPAIAAVVFVSVLSNRGTSEAWLGWVVFFLVLFAVAHDAGRRALSPRRFSGGLADAQGLALAGSALAALVAVGSIAIGPHLPGAHAAPVVSVGSSSRQGPSQRTTVSPLVDIKARLINQTDQLLFTVTSPQPSYWQLTSLDHFDGTIWSANEPYTPVSGPLPVARPTSGDSVIDQTYSIADLGSIWLPAAYLPVSISGITGVSWDGTTDSLISTAATSNGQHYRVVSIQPHFTPSELEQADLATVPAATRRRYLQLPGDVPADVVALARRVTSQATTPYDKALALQNYLRDNYTYSLNVPPGHSNSAIQNFLFVARRGYCEQFAGSYAVMARAIGLPTRVAVGFTPGQPSGADTWSVYGLDAHAWPEVLLGQFGWVSFDPTPGRGIPGATSYTGIPAQEPSLQGENALTTSPSAAPPRGATVRTTSPSRSAPAVHSALPPGSSGGWPAAVMAALALSAAAVLWGFGIPAAKRVRRARRRRRARSEAERVLLAWQEVNERLGHSGCPRRAAETLLEHAVRAAQQTRLGPAAAGSLQELAGSAAAAAYGRAAPSAADTHTARARAAEVQRSLAETEGMWSRLSRELDPRPLLSRSRD